MTIHFTIKETISIMYPFLHVNFFFRRQMTRTITIIMTKTPAIEPPMMASEIWIEHMCMKYFFSIYVVICYICLSSQTNTFFLEKKLISFILIHSSKVVLTQCAIIRPRGRYLVILDSAVYIYITFKCCCCGCCCYSSCRCWSYIWARMVTRHSHSRSVVTISHIEGWNGTYDMLPK